MTVRKEKENTTLRSKGLAHAIIIAVLLMYVTVLPILMIPGGGKFTNVLFVSPAIGFLLVILFLTRFNIIRLVLVVCLTIISFLMMFLSVYSTVVRSLSEERFDLNYLLLSGTIATIAALLLLIYSIPLQHYLYSRPRTDK